MIRPLTLLSIVAAAGAGLHVYNTKHAVSLLDRELRTIARDIGEAEARTKALNAEWSWATEQERLRALAHRHLSLEPMQPAQFLRLAEAERRLLPPAAPDGADALFAPRDAAPAENGGGTRIALLLPGPAPTQAPPPAPPMSRPVLAAVAQAAVVQAAQALPLPIPAAPELRPPTRNPVAFAPPPPPAARPAEARPLEARAPEPRPAAIAPVVRTAPPRPPAAAQVAVASVAPRAPETATALGSFASALGGASALGSARAALPPPVAFGSAGAALR